jgi:hypothetical protein
MDKIENNSGSTAKKAKGYNPSMKPREFGEMTQKEYISERLNDQLRYYDKVANRSKSRYLRSKFISVIAGALVPVLVNVEFQYVDTITTILSVLVVLIVSLESVFHRREQWVNSRSTSEALRKEYFLFSTKEGPYKKHTEDSDKAFIMFVERIEFLIESENNSTLQILTRESKQENQLWKNLEQNDVEQNTQ